ncbi:MAG: XdhC family protein, partial [Gemmatimonadales bacterium]
VPGVLQEHGAHLVALDLGEEDAVALGLTCGGAIDILVEVLDFGSGDTESGGQVRQALPLVPIVRIVSLGSEGGSGFVKPDGDMPPFVEEDVVPVVRQAVWDSFGSTRSAVIEASDPGLFVDYWGPPPHLVVVGATEVGRYLVALAAAAGYRTTVIDSRARFLSRDRFPNADALLEGVPSELVTGILIERSTSFALVVHDYKHDIPALAYLVDSPAQYIGLLAGGKRRANLMAMLRDRGLSKGQLARIRSPIGLDIAAESAAEIAVSILAEIQSHR